MKIKNKIILCVCSFILMICTMFSFSPITKSDNLVVKADEVVSNSVFVSNNVLVPIARYTFNYTNGVISNFAPRGVNSYATDKDFSFLFTFFGVRLRNNPDTGILEFAPSFYNITISDGAYPSSTGSVYPSEMLYLNRIVNTNSPLTDSTYTYSYTDTYVSLSDYGQLSGGSRNTNIIITDYSGSYIGSGYITDLTSSGSLSGIRMRVEYSSLNFDISKMSYVTLSLDNSYANIANSRYNITYYDSSNNFIRFGFYCGTYNFDYQTKTYYFNNPSLNDTESYNQGFQAGQQSGYNNGYEVGRSDGYNTGYNVGQDIGYNNGFSDGVEDSNQYTFLNLISATIDAPITYFQQLFNFNLLGVNLQGFLTGLFTLCVIVTIIKLCLGG